MKMQEASGLLPGRFQLQQRGAHPHATGNADTQYWPASHAIGQIRRIFQMTLSPTVEHAQNRRRKNVGLGHCNKDQIADEQFG